MKILFYNVAHCRGVNGRVLNYLTVPIRYLFNLHSAFQRRLSGFINEINSDVVCLAEVDTEHLKAFERNGYKIVLSGSRYGSASVLNHLPIVKNHYFAILSKKQPINGRAHDLHYGIKKAVAVVNMKDGLTIIMVHLALFTKGIRRKQLCELAGLINSISGDVILCGDFNSYGGDELDAFLKSTGLKSINPVPTCPTFKPRFFLDHFMVSKSVKVKEKTTFNVDYSDHLPIMLEISA